MRRFGMKVYTRKGDLGEVLTLPFGVGGSPQSRTQQLTAASSRSVSTRP
jgi:hypothetical protein